MSIVDYTYFVADISIGQRSQSEVREDLQRMINIYEDQLLTLLFGLKMKNEFILGLTQDPIDPKWAALKDGIIYNDGKSQWMGFANANKLSMIANYVYFYYTRKEVLQATGTGAVVPTNENSIVVNPLYKQVKAWNQMIDWICELDAYLKANKTLYPDYKWKDHKSPCERSSCYCECECCSHNKYPFEKINSLNI